MGNLVHFPPNQGRCIKYEALVGPEITTEAYRVGMLTRDACGDVDCGGRHHARHERGPFGRLMQSEGLCKARFNSK
jgi:hypothetical protein